MPSWVRRAAQRLGKLGIAFLIGLILLPIFDFANLDALFVLDVLTLIVLGIILCVRAFRTIKQRTLWSVRNRLLFVYGLFGVLPLVLLLVLIGLGTWMLMSELAIYLAGSALDRRIYEIRSAVESLEKIPEEHRFAAAAHLADALNETFPGITLYVKDFAGEHRFPTTGPPLQLPPGWKNVDGLLVLNNRYYAWAHKIDGQQEITALAPLSDEMIANLVPHLGVIALVEGNPKEKGGSSAAAGGIKLESNTEFALNESFASSPVHHVLPPPVSQFDVPVAYAATRPYYRVDKPGQTQPGLLLIASRPSAVLSSFFSGTESFRGFLFDVFVTVAILFLLVEIIALVIGVSLSRHITGAVKQLYEGTRRVIHGDFRHRLRVRNHDQLGELAESFNQMTGNLERLLLIEKEKERLQTELEIAREVQSQLYPKSAPPICGLRLSVRCDPARMVSGDYYDYEEIARGKLAFAVGDVAGKGISAALLMATLQAALRAQISQYQPAHENECSHLPELDAARLVSQLNQQIYAHTSPEKYATFFFALFDQKTRTLTYTNAGHLSPLLFRNGSVVPLDSNGTVIGAFPSSKYDESCLTIQRDDLLVCYTDGITEPENAYGEMFGEERLIDLVRKHSHQDEQEIIRIVLEAVRSWTGTPELYDDMTLLLAREVEAA